MVRVGLSEKASAEQREDGNKGVSYADNRLKEVAQAGQVRSKAFEYQTIISKETKTFGAKYVQF